MGLLENRVAFITGGSSGIGEGTARRFAQEGAAVAIADLQAEQGERVQRDIEAEGGKGRRMIPVLATLLIRNHC